MPRKTRTTVAPPSFAPSISPEIALSPATAVARSTDAMLRLHPLEPRKLRGEWLLSCQHGLGSAQHHANRALGTKHLEPLAFCHGG